MKNLYRKLRAFFALAGMLATAAIIAPLFGLTDKGLEWLSRAPYSTDCDYIVLQPGGGIPSPGTLMRAYYAAEEARKNPRAKVVISLKVEPPLEASTLWAIRGEIMSRGVAGDRIILETKATNTAEHAKFVREAKIGDPERDSYLLITSPPHIRRSVMAFEKAGFRHVYAAPAFGVGEKEDLGRGTFFRYDIWSAWSGEIDIARELVAIGWYKITGRV